MIGNDDVKTIGAGPVERLVRGDAAIDANHKFVTIAGGPFQRSLLDSVSFREAMGNVITNLCPQHCQRPHQDGGTGGAVEPDAFN